MLHARPASGSSEALSRGARPREIHPPGTWTSGRHPHPTTQPPVSSPHRRGPANLWFSRLVLCGPAHPAPQGDVAGRGPGGHSQAVARHRQHLPRRSCSGQEMVTVEAPPTGRSFLLIGPSIRPSSPCTGSPPLWLAGSGVPGQKKVAGPLRRVLSVPCEPLAFLPSPRPPPTG